MSLRNGWTGDMVNPWMPQVCYDPASLTLLATGVTAATGVATGYKALTAKTPELKIPDLSPTAKAPTEHSLDIQTETDRQLSLLDAKGRDSTNLTKKKRKGESLLDTEGPSVEPTSYINTSLG